MSKKAKIIIIIIASLAVLLVAYLLISPVKKQGSLKDSVQNLFPFGQPKSNQSENPASGLGTDYPTSTNPTGETPITGTIGNGTTPNGQTSNNGTSTNNGSTGPIGNGPSTNPKPTSPSNTPTTPATGTPAGATPSGATLAISASAKPLLESKPGTDVTTGINCYSRAGNTCFNKIETAIYYAKQEIAEIDQVITLLRGNSTTESITDQLMKLDQCIPGPDYGYEKRIRESLENNNEWKSIGADGMSTFDTRKKAGINIEISDVISNIRTEMSFTSKNIPMAASGLSFVNATPKYNDLLRDYKDRRTQKVRALASLENLNTQWKVAKAANNMPDMQQVTILFANLGQDLPTQDAWYEAANTRQNLTNDVASIKALQTQCMTQRGVYRTSFSSQKTYIGSAIQQPVKDIITADEAKKLFCSVDPYHVNNVSREISGDTIFQFKPSNPPENCTNYTGPDCSSSNPNWDGLWGQNNDVPYYALNWQNDWLDFTLFYTEDQINAQGMTLRQLFTLHNPELGYIGTIEDEETNMGAQGYLDQHPEDILIDDHAAGVGLRRHSLYSFGITCESFYKSSRYDYFDELTLYGF